MAEYQYRPCAFLDSLGAVTRSTVCASIALLSHRRWEGKGTFCRYSNLMDLSMQVNVRALENKVHDGLEKSILHETLNI